jgi:hypothetical protein
MSPGSGGRCSGGAALRLRGSLGIAGRCPLWPAAVCPCVTLRFCIPSRPPLLGGPGVSSCLVFVFAGFILVRSVVPPASPAVRCCRPAPLRQGGSRAFSGLLLVSVWGPYGLLHAGGLSCMLPGLSLVVLWGCSSGAGLSGDGPFPPAASTWVRAQGSGCPGVLVPSARLYPRGLSCGSGCVHGCGCRYNPCFAAHQPSRFCGVVERWRTFLTFVSQHVCWPDFAPVSALWCVVCGFPSIGFFPECWFLVIVASLVCSGLHSVVPWDVWPVLLGGCVWHLSITPPGVSHHCLSVLHIARCLSRGAPPKR